MGKAGGESAVRRPLGGNEVDDEQGIAVALEPAQLVTGWPVALSLATAASARSLLAGRRRSALNEAVHELRRPLQALALSAPAAAGPESDGTESSLQMVTAALERLDREINGGAVPAARAPLEPGPLLEAAVVRWRWRAALRGGSLRLRPAAPDLIISADRRELSRALDNLIVNAIEHGGPEVILAAMPAPGALRISVVDSGAAECRASGRRPRTGLRARLTGRRRHGHGLRVVRRVAAAHGGSFRLRRSAVGTAAELDLPLLGGGRR